MSPELLLDAIPPLVFPSFGEEELKRSWDSRDEEQKKLARKLGTHPPFGIGTGTCEYSSTAEGTDMVFVAFRIDYARARSKAEAAKVHKSICSGEAAPTVTYKPLSGIGDSACSIGDHAIAMVKNDVSLSILYVPFDPDLPATVDKLKPLAVKAASRLL